MIMDIARFVWEWFVVGGQWSDQVRLSSLGDFSVGQVVKHKLHPAPAVVVDLYLWGNRPYARVSSGWTRDDEQNIYLCELEPWPTAPVHDR